MLSVATRIGLAAGLVLLASCANSGGSAKPAERPAAQTDEGRTIQRMLDRLHEAGEFTGVILVARDGQPVFRDVLSSPQQAESFDEPVAIASLTKGFTAMAVMMLAEQGKLRYDDPIGRHVPALADAVPTVTVRHLLTHTSGIPDVGDLGIDHPNLLEREVVDAVRAQHQHFPAPGARYRYSNTNYNLLALIVGAVSGQRFEEVLQRSIFTPLGMNRTRPAASRVAGAAGGDGELVSTVDDLLRWDQAIATKKLVGEKTLAEGLAPAAVTEGTTTYAFGWNVAPRNGDTFIWHTGNSGDRRAFIGRSVERRITVIILTSGDSRRLEIADAVVDILEHRPFTPPRLSIARRLTPTAQDKGVDAAITLYGQLKTSESQAYDFGEGELNRLGYGVLGRGDVNGAVRIFELNAQQYPASSNVFDSLGDAYDRANRRDEARKAYARAIELDPANASARAKLEKLKE